MTETNLRSLLRNVLLASFATPLVLGSVACGGHIEVLPEAEDASPDRSPVPNPNPTPSPGCEGQACGGDCMVGCSLQSTCVDGTLECSCTCEVDAGFPDATVIDATFPDSSVTDASDPCHPGPTTPCTSYDIPLSCFDAALPDGPLSPQQCMEYCGPNSNPGFCEVQTDPQGQPAVYCNLCLTGRRPEGMRRTRVTKRGSVLGRYLARIAELEAASVEAFHILRAELAAHGAPAHLLETAKRAAEDEVRHTQMATGLARRYGARVPSRRASSRPRAAGRRVRSIEAIAIENIVEGCVRETYGALTAMAQAKAARDPKVRAVMARIAPDETRHAALAWAVAKWADSRLDAAGRARVREAKDAAVAELLRETEAPPPAALVAVAGVPDARRAKAMIEGMRRALWG
jgi:hypothetical protein